MARQTKKQKEHNNRSLGAQKAWETRRANAALLEQVVAGVDVEVIPEVIEGNGHDNQLVEEVTEVPPITKYKYRELRVRRVPPKYRHMTPAWLGRRLNWEEEAKVARVKPTGIGGKIKIGAAVVVLCLFGVVIFLFGAIAMGGE